MDSCYPRPFLLGLQYRFLIRQGASVAAHPFKLRCCAVHACRLGVPGDAVWSVSALWLGALALCPVDLLPRMTHLAPQAPRLLRPVEVALQGPTGGRAVALAGQPAALARAGLLAQLAQQAPAAMGQATADRAALPFLLTTAMRLRNQVCICFGF